MNTKPTEKNENTEVDEVNTEVNEANIEIDEANTEVNEANIEVDETDTEVNEVNTEIDEANTEVDEVKMEVDENDIIKQPHKEETIKIVIKKSDENSYCVKSEPASEIDVLDGCDAEEEREASPCEDLESNGNSDVDVLSPLITSEKLEIDEQSEIKDEAIEVDKETMKNVNPKQKIQDQKKNSYTDNEFVEYQGNSPRKRDRKISPKKADELTVTRESLKPGKRKIKPKSWHGDVISSVPSMPKKAKGGLRADCPSFCRQGCTSMHHPLLIFARRMIENDSSTTMVFLEHVAEYYGGNLDKMSPSDVIEDPWKNTNFPLLHYLALMGKCCGSFALIDAGHNPTIVVATNGDTVLHTMVREMYNFNCTHGHMDILVKKFNLLLKEFKDCLTIVNNDNENPFHVCANLIAVTSKLLNVPGRIKPPFRLYQFLKNIMSLCLEQFLSDNCDKTNLNVQDSSGNTIAHYLACDRASFDLLDSLKEHGAVFSLCNNEKQTVNDVKEKAPPAPPEDILELAAFSAKSNKYKASAAKKPRFSPSPREVLTMKRTVNVKKVNKDSSNVIVKASKDIKDTFMEMLTEKLSDTSKWEPIEKTSLKKTHSKPTKICNDHKKSKENIHCNIKSEKQELSPAARILQKFDLHNLNSVTSANVNSVTSVVSTADSKIGIIKTPSESDIHLPTTTTSSPVKPLKPPVMNTNTLSVKLPISRYNPTSSVLSATAKHYSGFKSKVISPEAILPHSNTQSIKTSSIPISYPLISNVQSLKTAVGSTGVSDYVKNNPLFIFRPTAPLNKPLTVPNMTTPNLTVPSMNIPNLSQLNTSQQFMKQVSNSAGISSQPPFAGISSQPPLIIKTADGKVVSLNVLQINGNTSINQPAPKLNISGTLPRLQNIQSHRQPRVPDFQVTPQQVLQTLNNQKSIQQYYMGPNGLRYIIPSSIGETNPLGLPQFRQTTNIRPMSSFELPTMVTNPGANTFISRLQFPWLPPDSLNRMMFNPSVSLQQQSPVFPQAPPNVTISKNDKKNRSLEASIKNLHNLTKHSNDNSTRKTNSRLSATVSATNESAPPVIILDNDDAVPTRIKEKEDSREVQSPSIESSQDTNIISKDMDSVGKWTLICCFSTDIFFLKKIVCGFYFIY